MYPDNYTVSTILTKNRKISSYENPEIFSSLQRYSYKFVDQMDKKEK